MTYAKGYDISEVQGNVNFEALAYSIDFIIIKCYEGNNGIDSMFHKNLNAAKNANIKTAVYNVIYPLQTDPAHPNRDPIDQASLHYNASEGEIMCVDCEWPAPQDWNKWNIDGPFISQWLVAYMQELSKLSAPRSPIIYSYPVWVKAVGFDSSLASYPLWAASYGTSSPLIEPPFTDWLIWQYSDGGGKLPSGAPVDQNYCKDMSMWI